MTGAPLRKPCDSLADLVKRCTGSFRLLYRSESGMALVVVLVVALAVALVGVAMADNVVRETQIAANESSAVVARYLAEAGIADAAAHLSQDNTWQGPITQTLGAGTYTVQVDPNVSQLGALGAVKSVLSTGTISYSGLTAATQTVRETLLVLPQVFSKPLVSGTVVVVSNTTGANGAEPTIQNTVLRQLGAVHANNAQNEAAAFQQITAGTLVTGQVTYVTGTTTLAPLCIACAPAKIPSIPVPAFNFCPSATTCTTLSACPSPATPNDPYSCKAFHSPSPCPSVQANNNFATQTLFDKCVTATGVADAQGFVNFTGTVFVNESTFFIPDKSSQLKFRFTGSLVTYNATAAGCSATAPCGDLVWVNWVSTGNKIIFNAQNGEPAILAGGNTIVNNGSGNSCNTNLSPGIVTINGLVVVLAHTTNPAVTAPLDPGYCIHGSSTIPVTIKGALYTGRVNGTTSGSNHGFDTNSLTYDPSIFYPGLPSALVTPTAPFVLLPISWSSGK